MKELTATRPAAATAAPNLFDDDVARRFASIDEGFSLIDQIFESCEQRLAALEAKFATLQKRRRRVIHERNAAGEITSSVPGRRLIRPAPPPPMARGSRAAKVA